MICSFGVVSLVARVLEGLGGGGGDDKGGGGGGGERIVAKMRRL